MSAWDSAVTKAAWGRVVELAREYQAGEINEPEFAESINDVVIETEGI